MQTRPRPKKYVRYNRKARPVEAGRPNLELRPYQVLIRPLVTEKGTHLSTHHNAYTFMVNLHSTKIDVKNAVEDLFNVRVLDVRTQIRHGKKTPLSSSRRRDARLETRRRLAARGRQDRILLVD
jgi:large subunit ribosomal protein L23